MSDAPENAISGEIPNDLGQAATGAGDAITTRVVDPSDVGQEKYQFLSIAQANGLIEGMRSEVAEGLLGEEVSLYFPIHAQVKLRRGRYVDLERRVIDFKVREQVSARLLDPTAITTPEDLITQWQLCFHGDYILWDRQGMPKPTKLLVDGIAKFIGAHPEDATEILDRLLAFDVHMRNQTESESRNLSWKTVVRSIRRDLSIQGEQPYTLVDFDPSSPTTDFWRKFLTRIRPITDKDLQRYDRIFAFGSEIATKSPEFLLNLLLRVDDDEPSQVFGLSPRDATTWAYDNFQTILRETAQAGWGNAQVLVSELDQLPKRDLPHHAIIIHLSNRLTPVLNKITDFDATLSPLKPTDAENVGEAINRCLYAVFELGAQAEDTDPFNFLVSAEIVTAVFAEAALLAQPVEPSDQETRIEAHSRKYRELLAASRGKRTFWRKWTEGYGLFS